MGQIRLCKIRFVSTAKNCRKTCLVCKKLVFRLVVLSNFSVMEELPHSRPVLPYREPVFICSYNFQVECIIRFLYYRRNRGYYMSAHVLLNLLNNLREKMRCDALPSFLCPPASLINSLLQTEHECKILFIIRH